MALNMYSLTYHETDEARVLREAYNLGRVVTEDDVEEIGREMGLADMSAQEKLELPTSAGSALLDLSILMGDDQPATSQTLQSKPARLDKRTFDAALQQAGAVDISDSPNGSRILFRTSKEDAPPLTAEDAKARATRTAMLVEYAHRHQFPLRASRQNENENRFDEVLSA